MIKEYRAIFLTAFKIDSFKKGYYWILLIAGAIFVAMGKLTVVPLPQDWKDFFATLGTITLTSGIFTSLLKTVQYIGYIKEELAKIIYDVEYLKKRNDLEDFWKKVNTLFFGEKFPEINEAIQNDIKQVFLPNRAERYYKNYHFEITIQRHEKNPDFIIVEQLVTVDIVTDNPEKTIKIKFQNKQFREKHNEEDPTTFELLFWKVNSVNQDVVFTTDSPDITKYHIKLQGKKLYRLERKSKSVYSLKADPFKVFKANNYIIHTMTVDMILPKDLTCDFQSVGTLKKFTAIETSANNHIKMHYDGLIYSNQGFRIFFKDL